MTHIKAIFLAILTTVRAKAQAVLHKSVTSRDLAHMGVVLVATFVAMWLTQGSPVTHDAIVALLPAVGIAAFRQLFPGSAITPESVLGELRNVVSALRLHPQAIGKAVTDAAIQITEAAAVQAATGAGQKAVIDAAKVAGEAAATKVLDQVGTPNVVIPVVTSLDAPADNINTTSPVSPPAPTS